MELLIKCPMKILPQEGLGEIHLEGRASFRDKSMMSSCLSNVDGGLVTKLTPSAQQIVSLIETYALIAEMRGRELPEDINLGLPAVPVRGPMCMDCKYSLGGEIGNTSVPLYCGNPMFSNYDSTD